MTIKRLIKPENRIKMITALGPVAGLAFILAIFLGRLQDSNLDLITGFLTGFSIVGNLAYIFVVTRHLAKKGE